MTTTQPQPAIEADWELLTQQLGHTETWPPHWHQLLAIQGQAALLRQAAADMAPPVRGLDGAQGQAG